MKRIRYIILAVKYLIEGDSLDEARRFAHALVYGFKRSGK